VAFRALWFKAREQAGERAMGETLSCEESESYSYLHFDAYVATDSDRADEAASGLRCRPGSGGGLHAAAAG